MTICFVFFLVDGKMSNYLSDEPFLSEEDLFFHKLFGEDELSQRQTSKTIPKYVNLNIFFFLKTTKYMSK